MKKLVAAFIGLIMVSIAVTSVSAAEYEVHKGDSLWKIANENTTTVETLMEINELKSSLIHPKQVLKLEEKEATTEFYIVQEGDTLIHIRSAHGDDVSVEELKAWNNLSSDLIITGQKLIVNEAAEAEKVEEESSGQTANIESEDLEKEKVKITTASSEEVSEPEVETAEIHAQQAEEKAEPKEQVAETKTEQQVNGRTFAVESTAYTAGCNGCSGITATGINLNNDRYAKVIAVDPNVIPLGTQVYVEGYGYAVAGDTGGAIKGNKIDVHLPTKSEAYSWGRKMVNITVIE
ncbi:LysM peptidoglycan-binding domain-containing protein [Oceanobacillus sp. CF4.6]|uniref:3D domain-containing protein n=1 Tax=Oceanobacillus sp. CF4.6 TaxID=3373080 RepID=UPI003EE6DA73